MPAPYLETCFSQLRRRASCVNGIEPALDTPEGRKLMGDPKRKNLQYQAASYAAGSPERLVARRFLLRETERKQALTELEDIFSARRAAKIATST